MDAISKALIDIKFAIPREVLDLAFIKRHQYYTAEFISVDKLIMNNVIEAKILPDLNVVRGQEISIDLSECEMMTVSPDAFRIETVIKVPPRILNGRNIISPLQISLEYGPTNSGGNSYITQIAEAAVNSKSAPTGFTTTDLELIGNNTILVHENVPLVIGYLSVMIENDKNMNNLNPSYYNTFGDLCILATKAYIYNTLVVDLNKGLIIGGRELSVIKDIIDGYSSAYEDYRTMLKEIMGKILFMNDDKSYSKFIQMSVNPFL